MTVDREEEIWLIHDLNLYAETEEDLEELLQIEQDLIAKGTVFAVELEEEEDDMVEMRDLYLSTQE